MGTDRLREFSKKKIKKEVSKMVRKLTVRRNRRYMLQEGAL